MKRNKRLTLTILIINIVMFIILIFLPNIMIKYVKITEPLKLLFNILLFFIPSYVAFLFYYIAKRHNANIKTLMFILNILTFLCSIIITITFNLSNIIISETSNIKNYMKFDVYVNRLCSKEMFPRKILSSATEIKYFYRYRGGIDQNYDIFLQYRLSEEDYNKEKNRIITLYPNLKRTESSINNDFIDYYLFYGNTSYTFVSFSEKEFTIKYIDSYNVNFNEDNIPYFMQVK